MQLTLTLTRFAESNDLVAEALGRLAAQEGVSGEILFIDQSDDENLTAHTFLRGEAP